MKCTKKYCKRHPKTLRVKFTLIAILLMTYTVIAGLCYQNKCLADPQIISPVVASSQLAVVVDSKSTGESAKPSPVLTKTEEQEGETRIEPTPMPSELEQIVAYIARKFEPEGKDVVVRAINCFYSESGLRANAVGQNTDKHRSKDHGVAQLNDYWHNLTPEMKTDIYANIDKAYEIYKGRGGNFSAWYGKLCNI